MGGKSTHKVARATRARSARALRRFHVGWKDGFRSALRQIKEWKTSSYRAANLRFDNFFPSRPLLLDMLAVSNGNAPAPRLFVKGIQCAGDEGWGLSVTHMLMARQISAVLRRSAARLVAGTLRAITVLVLVRVQLEGGQGGRRTGTSVVRSLS